MRLGNLSGRAVIIAGGGAVDVHHASGGRFGPHLPGIYRQWPEFSMWASTASLNDPASFDEKDLEAPSPLPRQVFAVGLNYRDHAAESGQPVPENLTVFTKFASSFTGPHGVVAVPKSGNTDWEVELVIIVGAGGRDIPASNAWDHVAGLTVGQDLSERIMQQMGSVPQFSLAKSFAGFSPTGPWLVTPNELSTPDDLEIGALLNGSVVQLSRTSELIFPVSEIIAGLSKVVQLYPGDVIFTGTPAGVGFGLKPPVFLRPGDELESYIEGIGRMKHAFVGESSRR